MASLHFLLIEMRLNNFNFQHISNLLPTISTWLASLSFESKKGVGRILPKHIHHRSDVGNNCRDFTYCDCLSLSNFWIYKSLNHKKREKFDADCLPQGILQTHEELTLLTWHDLAAPLSTQHSLTKHGKCDLLCQLLFSGPWKQLHSTSQNTCINLNHESYACKDVYFRSILSAHLRRQIEHQIMTKKGEWTPSWDSWTEPCKQMRYWLVRP